VKKRSRPCRAANRRGATRRRPRSRRRNWSPPAGTSDRKGRTGMPSRSLGSRERRRGPAVGGVRDAGFSADCEIRGRACGTGRRAGGRVPRTSVSSRGRSTRDVNPEASNGLSSPSSPGAAIAPTSKPSAPESGAPSLIVLPRNGARRTLPPNSKPFFFTRDSPLARRGERYSREGVASRSFAPRRK
jgi:hypothetical protein